MKGFREVGYLLLLGGQSNISIVVWLLCNAAVVRIVARVGVRVARYH